MSFRKSTIIAIVILTITLLSTPVSSAQGILGGILQAAAERYIDNSGYSSQDKENMKNALNSLSNELNVNQNAANATRDAYNGNYTGAVIQGAQTIMNATGNYQYDTYLNSANQINNANRQYNQDIQNGMDRDAALDKRNTTIGYSTAESVIELQDKIARERAEKAWQQRETERQSRENNNYYTAPSYNETNSTSSSYNTNRVVEPRDYSSKESSYYKNVNNTTSFNSNAKTLSSTNSVVFKTDDGEYIFLSIPFRYYGEGYSLSYNNQSSKAVRLICDRTSIKVKYVRDNSEQTFTDRCSFVMPAHTNSKMEISDVFPKLSDASSIESIKVLFVNTQIIEEKELYGNGNSSNNSNSISYSNNSNNDDNNSDVHLLTKNKIVKFFVGEDKYVALGIDKDSGRLFYNNMYNDRNVRLSCNKVSIKVKYVGDDYEQTITDACSFVMRANTYDYLDWSDVFFSISDTRVIESIKVSFAETQIR